MPPVIIAGGIAAAGAIGAAAIGSKGASKAAATQQQSNDASLAVQQQVYQQNAAALAPWQQSGLQANGILTGALGFGGQQQAPVQQQIAPAGAERGYGGAYTQAGTNRFQGIIDNMGNPNAGPAALQLNNPQGTNAGQAGTAQQGQSNGQAANSAFDSFLNSINYNWQLGQGQKALNGAYAGSGTLQSGAALKGLTDYNQNMARGAYQDWFGGVENVANRGFGAASAQAGVGQNYANNVSNLNSANANALSGLQIAKANNTASAIGGIGAIGANVLGSVLAPKTPSYAGVLPNTNAFAGYQF